MVSNFSNLRKRGSAILLRGGGLGDFILTLPLLSYIRKQYRKVTLLTKPSYFCLTPLNKDNFECIELDLGVQSVEEQIEDSDIFTFWKDPAWEVELKKRGASRVFTLPSRPHAKPHVIDSMFNLVGASLTTKCFTKAWLEDCWQENSMIWIHPGSGSVTKNIPFSFYKNLAEDWLRKSIQNEATFCFGEADQAILDSFEPQSFVFPKRVHFAHPSTVEEYKNMLTSGIAQFWGNDSGPSHLAANLGIPTNVCFQSTHSEIWKPTGPRVTIHEFGQDAS